MSYGEWEEHIDERYNRKYWHNERTGETSWLPPAAARAPSPAGRSGGVMGGPPPPKRPRTGCGDAVPGPWEEHFDDTHGRKYWHNPVTKETSWTPPEGHGHRGAPFAPAGAAAPPPKRPRLGAADCGAWEEHFDDTHGRKYWHNPVTKETSWTPPGEAQSDAARSGQPAAGHSAQPAGAYGGRGPSGPPSRSLVSVPIPKDRGVAIRTPHNVVPRDVPRVDCSVVEWDPRRGFGFVTCDDPRSPGRRAFVHRRFFNESLTENLEPGERITAVLSPDERNPGKFSALDVHRGALAKVAEWDPTKGFGFVVFTQDNRRAFVHRRFLAAGGESRQENLTVGDVVTATCTDDPKSAGKFCAVAVQREGDSIAPQHAVQRPNAPPPPPPGYR
eukprot:TRINITY_DN5474_c0_g1_i3.p1 TRINITY_DN5474_c0_g1~~TRINITY_DN5474_c0_g1_i3.p1  ORF type:complete len:411 (+),score=90.81 TRINITY_DN5474_c0_g1_i3:75-1235(+)